MGNGNSFMWFLPR